MSTFILVRHAHTDAIGKVLAGRMPGVYLNHTGRKETGDLAKAFAGIDVGGVFSSPLERARQTAEAIAAGCGREVRVSERLNEIDCGDWTGRTFSSLDQDRAWIRFNRQRSLAGIPGGERMIQVQSRILEEMEILRLNYPEESLVLVSHGDVIKAALCHHMGISLDFILRISISPASISALCVTEDGAEILFLNRKIGPILV